MRCTLWRVSGGGGSIATAPMAARLRAHTPPARPSSATLSRGSGRGRCWLLNPHAFARCRLSPDATLAAGAPAGAGAAPRGAMADDFEKAVLFSFDQSGAVDAALRAQALSLLASAKAQPDAWQLFLARFQASQYVEVRFWCIQALHELVAARHSALPPHARQQLRGALLASGAAAPPLPPFLRNKVAQALVALAANEFPQEWPTFFQDLLALLPSGLPAVDLFCR